MSEPDVLVAMPVYQGSEVVAEALRSIRDQTYSRYRVLISIDGDDPASLAACLPFCEDPRFSLVVQPERLGWHRNFNWLFDRCDLPYICYWQQDDLAATNYLETLRTGFVTDPDAAIHYADVQWFGAKFHRDSTPSVIGSPMARVLECIEATHYAPLRGLIRTDLLPRPDVLDPLSDDGSHSAIPFLAKMAARGSLRRLEGTLYFKRLHANNTHQKWNHWSWDRRRRTWIDMGLGLLDAADRAITQPEQRHDFIAFILDRLCISRAGRGFFYQPAAGNLNEIERFVRDFLWRGRIELPVVEDEEFWGKNDPFRRPIHPLIQTALKNAALAQARRCELQERLQQAGDWSAAVDASDDEGALLLAEGWSRREAWGVWSDGPQAAVWLPISKGQWQVRLELHHFGAPGASEARICWVDDQCNDRRSITIPTNTSVPLDWTIDAEASGSSLKLIFPDAVHLPDIGSPDKRTVAVGLKKVNIRRAA